MVERRCLAYKPSLSQILVWSQGAGFAGGHSPALPVCFMNRRMPNGTSVWCGKTAGVIPPPTRLGLNGPWTDDPRSPSARDLGHPDSSHSGESLHSKAQPPLYSVTATRSSLSPTFRWIGAWSSRLNTPRASSLRYPSAFFPEKTGFPFR